MREEQILFIKAINRVKFFLKLSGIYIEDDDGVRTLLQRLRGRSFFCFNMVWMNIASCSWFAIAHRNAQEFTYMLPCIILCFVGAFKSYYFVSCRARVIQLIEILKNLQAITETSGEVEIEMKKERLPFLKLTNNILLLMGVLGIASFCFGPIAITVSQYLATGEVQLVLPFLLPYPFDAYDVKYWPIAFLHQFWAAWITVFFVYGPDCFYYTCCVFIHLQLSSLRRDMAALAAALLDGRPPLLALLRRHRACMRCIELLEIIYGRSTLVNAISSSLIICVTGFNILAIEDPLKMAPFTPFLVLGSLQIFLFCYYGDLLMCDCTDISEAVYATEWYDLDAKNMKYCLFIIMRAQKPCKITAHGFTDINMSTFTKIMSWAWSYFTLLKSMYNKN